MTNLNDLAAAAGVRLFDYQVEALTAAAAMPGPSQRICLYYKTGAGKSLTSLLAVRQWGHSASLVVAPPSTHKSWQATAEKLGMEIQCMSHAKFRMKDTKVSRTMPVIADEMHQFGGHSGQGWKKLDRLAGGLQAPLVMASATPNYNDADRVYCIQHILDPVSCHGGFLEFVYKHCTTEQNPFGMMPKVTGFLRYPDAAAYLAALPGVFYLPDDLVYVIDDVPVSGMVLNEMDVFGYDRRRGRIIASIIEEKHTRIFHNLVDDQGYLRDHVYDALAEIAGNATGPLLVYADHSTIAKAASASLNHHHVGHQIVTGATSKKQKDAILESFKAGEMDVLIGTASLATGTDGLDKVCDTLVILDDTEDASLRRQLIGRIMPRGADSDASKKQVYRIVVSP